MTLAVWQRTIVTAAGDAIPNAEIEVFVAGTLTNASLFADAAGTTPLTNPFNATGAGFAQFYVAPGQYDITASGGGSSITWDDVRLDGGGNVVFTSRAQAIAARVPAPVVTIAVLHAGVWCHYERDASGTALTTADGQNWKPADGMPVTPEHFGGTNHTAINAAVALSREVRLAAKTYTCSGDVTLGDTNSVFIRGAGANATFIDFAAGGKFEVKGCFDCELADFTVQNGTGDNIVLGNQAGAQTFFAYLSVRNVNSLSAGGVGVKISNAYMGDITNVRSNASTSYGFDFSGGHNTTLSISNCHALNGSSDGWYLRSMSYCNFFSLGSDDNAGYGYVLQGLDGCFMSGCGAEDCGKAAMHFVHDAGSGDTILKMRGMLIDGFKSNNNAQTVTTNGEIAHFTSISGAVDAGDVEFRGLVSVSQSHEAFHCESGQWVIYCDFTRQNITSTVKGGSFCVVADPSQDVAKGLPINIDAANTPVALIGPKMPNGITAFGGVITVYASNNPLNSTGGTAVYQLMLAQYNGGSSLKLVDSTGLTAGAASAHPSFTWNWDSVNNHLEATRVGSTAAGDYYLFFTVQGNLALTPL